MRNGTALLEREIELDQLEGALVGQPAAPAYIEAFPGMGKTSLLVELAGRAEERGHLVLRAVGAELERGYRFGVVQQLFDGLPPTIAASLDPTDLTEPDRQDSDGIASPFPALQRLSRVLVEAAGRCKLVVLVDDAQWADVSSLRFLDYLAVRLDRHDLGLVIAARPIDRLAEQPDPAAVLLARIRDRQPTVLVEPGPLGIEASAAFLAIAFGRDPDRDFAAECQKAVAGNPFFLGELADSMVAEGMAPGRENLARIGESGPDSVARSVARRIEGLPEESELVLSAVAVLGGRVASPRVARLTGIPVDEVSRLADRLAGVGLLVDGRPLGFHHPIVARAVYEQLPAGRRAALHAASAAVLTEDGVPAEGVGPHLIAAEPAADQVVVETLRSAAGAAMEQGEPNQAREFLERALLEPPTPGARPGLLAELGVAELAIGRDFDRASRLLEEAAARSADPVERVAWIEEAARARLYAGQLEAAVRILNDGREDLGSAQEELALRLTAHAAGIGILRPGIAEAELRRLEEVAEASGDNVAELAALAELGGSRWREGRIAEATGFARRALSGGLLLQVEGPVSVAFNHAVAVLIDADELEPAMSALGDGIELGARRGSLLGVASLMALRSLIFWRRGEIERVVSETTAVLDLLEESSTPTVDPAMFGILALARSERGELEEAKAAMDRIGDLKALPRLTYLVAPFVAGARIAMLRSQPEVALELMVELDSRQEEMGVRHLTTPWGYVAVEAAVALGDRSEARRISASQMKRAIEWTVPSSTGSLLAARGLALGGEEGIALMRKGASILERSPARLEEARVLVDLGSTLRRDGHRVEAREVLNRALDLTRRCGAVSLGARAEAELLTAGARPRRRQFSGADSLTASERRVAELAASGATNREIAAGLVISVRTVENHLSRTYRKLGIKSRVDLVRVLSEP